MGVCEKVNKVTGLVHDNWDSYAVKARRQADACPERDCEQSRPGTVSAVLGAETVKQTKAFEPVPKLT